MAYTRKQINEMFEKLPDDLQEALDSNETIGCLKQLEKKYNLQPEQVKELSAEIGMLMMGASSPQHFIPNIEKSMKIPNETAKAIVAEVNEKIFRPVKESLKNLHLLSEKSEEIKPAAAPTEEAKKNIPLNIPMKTTEKKPEIPKKEEGVKAPDLYREAV